MKYNKGEDRRQYVLFPACLYEYIEQDNPVRYIDAFVDSQDLEELGFNHTKREAPGNGGRPSTLTEAKNDLEHEIVEVVADKGYQDQKTWQTLWLQELSLM